MTEANPEKTPEIKSTQLEEQPTAVLRETVPMNALKEFFGRAYQAVMAAAGSSRSNWPDRLSPSTTGYRPTSWTWRRAFRWRRRYRGPVTTGE